MRRMQPLSEVHKHLTELVNMRDPARGDHARAVERLINIFYGDRDGFIRHHLALLKNIDKEQNPWWDQ